MELAGLRGKLDRLEKQLQDVTQSRNEALSELKQYEIQLKQLVQQRSDMEREHGARQSELEARYAILEKQRAEDCQLLDALRKQTAEQDNEVQLLRANTTALQNELKGLRLQQQEDTRETKEQHRAAEAAYQAQREVASVQSRY
jgi:septal ring factor EnvC (AmiA/AmiB activator)